MSRILTTVTPRDCTLKIFSGRILKNRPEIPQDGYHRFSINQAKPLRQEGEHSVSLWGA